MKRVIGIGEIICRYLQENGVSSEYVCRQIGNNISDELIASLK